MASTSIFLVMKQVSHAEVGKHCGWSPQLSIFDVEQFLLYKIVQFRVACPMTDKCANTGRTVKMTYNSKIEADSVKSRSGSRDALQELRWLSLLSVLRQYWIYGELRCVLSNSALFVQVSSRYV